MMYVSGLRLPTCTRALCCNLAACHYIGRIITIYWSYEEVTTYYMDDTGNKRSVDVAESEVSLKVEFQGPNVAHQVGELLVEHLSLILTYVNRGTNTWVDKYQ